MKLRAILRINTFCNNNCLFCHSADYIKKNDDVLVIKKKIIKAKEKNINEILLSGGEPTTHPKINKIIKEISSKNMTYGFITNARMFSYEQFCQKIITKNCKYIYLSLHSHDKKEHNTITGDNSFEQTIKGIKNINDYYKKKLIINCVLTSINQSDLINYINFIQEFKLKNYSIKFSLPQIKGNFLINKKYSPNLNILKKELKKTFVYCKEKNIKICFESIPLCLIDKQFHRMQDNLITNNIKYMSEPFEDDFFLTSHGKKIFLRKCDNCALKNDICPGIEEGYEEQMKKIKMN